MLDAKEKALAERATDGQRQWIKSVFAYVECYYDAELNNHFLINACRRNKPILTTAPGGCGKSWLMAKSKTFIDIAVPGGAFPGWFEKEKKNAQGYVEFWSHDEGNESERRSRRFGKTVTFAPSGVAAGNAHGCTFHSGLSTFPIATATLEAELDVKFVARMQEEFSDVVLILVDEVFNASLTCLTYLDKLLRRARPALCNIPYGGVVVVALGDPYQLPVVLDSGILPPMDRVAQMLQATQLHLRKGVFFLELTESLRQKADMKFAQVLNRIRVEAATEEDAVHLNQRHLDLDQMPHEQQNRWKTAAILTTKKNVVNALNRIGVIRNGSSFGAFNGFAIPNFSRCRGREKKLKRAKAFFSGDNMDFIPAYGQGSDFKPPKMLPVYYGMPIMLRTNICPEIGYIMGLWGE